MHKTMNIFAVLTIALVTCAPTHAMDGIYASDYVPRDEEPNLTAQQRILFSSSNQDHLRFGKLNIPNPMAPADDAAVTAFLNQREDWRYEHAFFYAPDYPKNRDLIAQSVRRKELPNASVLKQFLIIASNKQDGILICSAMALTLIPN